MKISVLTIGDEICIGQVINTNASWISKELTKIGASVINHSIVGDEKSIIISELSRLIGISDMVIITGGLGPTHDDITKSVLSEFFNDKLIFHDETFNYISHLFESRGRTVTEKNRNQAYLPSKCEVLKNSIGTAPGMLFNENGKIIISLPGVPEEMKWIMNNSILPMVIEIIKKNELEIVIYRTIQTTGIPESSLADLLGSPDDFLEGSTLAFLPSSKGVRLRIGSKGTSPELVRNKIDLIEIYIRDKANKFIVSSDEKSLLQIVCDLLMRQNKTISVAESCTGGQLGANFTEVPGSSAYFLGGIISYSNEVKMNQLSVKEETIKEFGAVSEECAFEMAKNVCEKFNSDYAISITGIAGPDGGTVEKPVGLVYIGFSSRTRTFVKKFNFWGFDRQVIRDRSVNEALRMIYDTFYE